MSINKVLSGSYQARIKTISGRIISKCFKKKIDAINWEKTKLAEFSKNVSQPFLNLGLNKTLNEACDEWLRRKIIGFKANSTVTSYNTSVTKYINRYLGEELLCNLKEIHGDIFIKLLKEANLDPKTINRHVLVLKMVLNFCVTEGWITKSPFNRIENLKVSEKGFNFLNKLEIKSLLDRNKDEGSVYALLLIALNTGLRSGEICGLCWDAIDFKTGIIHIKRTMSKSGLSERTKTNQIRFIPLNDTLIEFFGTLKANKANSKFVVVNKNGRPFDPSHISNRVFKKALQRAGIKTVRFHDLRHTYASHFMMNNGNIYDLQRILGHTKIDMTQKYAHLSPGYLVKAVNTIQFSASSEEEFPESFQSKLKIVE